MAQLLVDLWPLFITLGAAVAAGGLASAKHAKKTWDWPLAEAVITHVSKVGEERPWEPGDSTVAYDMQVRWSYRVGDATYLGSQYMYAYGHLWHRSRAPELIKKYKPGKVFQVRYCPDKPRDHLAGGPKNPGVGYGGTFFGAATAIAGVFLVAGGTWLWPAAIGVAAVGAVGALVYIVAYPRKGVTDGLLNLYGGEP